MAADYSNFLFEQLSFLHSLDKQECFFDLNEFEFSKDCLSDEQIVGMTLTHIIENKSPLFLDYAEYIKKTFDVLQEKGFTQNYPTIAQVRR